MSLLIKNLEMPTEGELLCIDIHPDGKVCVNLDLSCTKVGTAVSVPPHGDLIEESKVLDIVTEWCPDDDGSVGKDGDLREMLDEIEALPTVIEADNDINVLCKEEKET